jgi:hypothetical protein
MLGVDQTIVETNWDFLNLLTDSAKTHGDMRKRSRAESRALMMAMQPSAFNGIVTEGFSKTASKADFLKELKGFSPRNN